MNNLFRVLANIRGSLENETSHVTVHFSGGLLLGLRRAYDRISLGDTLTTLGDGRLAYNGWKATHYVKSQSHSKE